MVKIPTPEHKAIAATNFAWRKTSSSIYKYNAPKLKKAKIREDPKHGYMPHHLFYTKLSPFPSMKKSLLPSYSGEICLIQWAVIANIRLH